MLIITNGLKVEILYKCTQYSTVIQKDTKSIMQIWFSEFGNLELILKNEI